MNIIVTHTGHNIIKVKVTPWHAHAGTEAGINTTQLPGRLTPGIKRRYPLYRRLGGSRGHYGRARKISCQPGFDPGTVKYIAVAIPIALVPAT